MENIIKATIFYITFSSSANAINAAKQRQRNEYRFLSAIAVVDGTQVIISSSWG
jgi:hypothetical protein